jgi:predicted nuclease with RNAse H fold
VDVGGPRKGFDVALVDERRLLWLESGLRSRPLIELIESERPIAVAIDSPRSCAAPGKTARDSERHLASLICGIRWTPDETRVRASPYYAWVAEGLALFDALEAVGVEAIEVFPTASWTRWLGRRGTQTRSAWSQQGMAALGLEGVPTRTNQDQRDAIAAAVTACQHTHGLTQKIGEIIVPAAQTLRSRGQAHSN